jgi:molecular chaperone GrpE
MTEEELNGEAGEEFGEEPGVEELKQALAEEQEKAEKYLANWQRAQADFVNFKRRTEQEKEDLGAFARSALMLSFLPVLDDLARALDSVPPEIADNSWVDGIRLIERKAVAELEAQGLCCIDCIGEQFDPNLHEAVRQAEGEEGVVLEEAQKGYTLGDKVIRPSRVVVGSGEAQNENNRDDRT